MTGAAPGQAGGFRPAYQTAPEPTGWVGWVFFAGMMLIVTGIFQAIDGLVGLFKDDLYVVRPDGLVVTFDYSAWGWIHLLVGVALVLIGLAVLVGQTWARVIAIIIAVVSAIVNFAFIPAYPVWSLLIITLDVVVIYALAAHGREARSVTRSDY